MANKTNYLVVSPTQHVQDLDAENSGADGGTEDTDGETRWARGLRPSAASVLPGLV